MPELNWLAIAAAAVLLFVVSSVYYVAVAARLIDLAPADDAGGGMPPWKMGVELIRNLVLATVVAGLAAVIGLTDLAGALQLGLVLWIGFPVVLLAGSVLWENVDPKRAAVHAGDWLLKLLLAAAVIAMWP